MTQKMFARVICMGIVLILSGMTSADAFAKGGGGRFSGVSTDYIVYHDGAVSVNYHRWSSQKITIKFFREGNYEVSFLLPRDKETDDARSLIPQNFKVMLKKNILNVVWPENGWPKTIVIDQPTPQSLRIVITKDGQVQWKDFK